MSKLKLKPIHELIKSLLKNKPYYGYTLNKFTRKYSDEIPTACVIPSKKQLLVNKEYFDKLKLRKHQMGILEHEILHLGFFHYDRYEMLMAHEDKNTIEGKMKHDIFNVAADCAINQYIPNLPNGCITLSYVRGLANDITLKEKETTEYYFHALLKSDEFKKQLKKNKALQQLIDDISKGFDVTRKNYDNLSKNEIKNILKYAKHLQQKHEKNIGTNPGNGISDFLPDYSGAVHKKIWEKLIDRIFGETPQAKKSYYYGRISRRDETSLFYTKHDLESTEVYVGVDSSASVSNDDLNIFAGYIQKAMRKNNCTVTLIVADVIIHDVLTIKSAKRISQIEIKGRGGTDLRVIPEYIISTDKRKNKRLILLTDGGTPWGDYPEIKTSVVYTKSHDKFNEAHVYNSAVLGE
jgi:predicted metal-dependent peptidase